MTHTHAKGQGNGRRDGRTDERTEAIALPPVLTRSVKLIFYLELTVFWSRPIQGVP